MSATNKHEADLLKIIDDQEACISKILTLTEKSKIGPVPKKYGVNSWCAGYEQAIVDVQAIVNAYVADPEPEKTGPKYFSGEIPQYGDIANHRKTGVPWWVNGLANYPAGKIRIERTNGEPRSPRLDEHVIRRYDDPMKYVLAKRAAS